MLLTTRTIPPPRCAGAIFQKPSLFRVSVRVRVRVRVRFRARAS